MDKYMWIIDGTIEAWRARETFYVLPGTVFVSEPGGWNDAEGVRAAFLRYADGELTINNERIDVGDYLPQFLGIIDAVEESKRAVVTIRPQA